MKTPTNREIEWVSPVATLIIERFQPDSTGTLRGWDTADDYLIRETIALLDTHPDAQQSLTLAIIDDDFGALTTAIVELAKNRDGINALHVIADSSHSVEAIQANVNANTDPIASTAPLTVNINTSFSALPTDLRLDVILMKVPKTMAAFKSQLRQLRSHMTKSSCILAASMVKHLLPSAQENLESLIGPTTKHLAVKKSRLYKTDFDPELKPGKSPYPRTLQIDSLNISITSDAGVFSASKADPASLFLCEHLPEGGSDKKVVMDLGCGSGLLGLAAGLKYPDSRLCFVDASALAVQNARQNYQQLFPDADALFMHQHRLLPWPHDPVDLIICNPPFHQKHTVTLDVSQQMFSDARDIMRAGAELYVVANRHLPYDNALKRLFGNHRVAAQNTKFKIHRVVKRG